MESASANQFVAEIASYDVTMTDDEVVFSIITPVFNGEKYLTETICSVLHFAEGYSFEYILVNDGSTDTTLQIIEGYGDKVRVFNQVNSGESQAVNKGIEESKGKYLLVVSADDPLCSSGLFLGVEEQFAALPNLVAIYPDWFLIDSQGEILKENRVPDFSIELLIGESRVLPGPGTIFAKSAAISIGGRNRDWRFVGDFDFWLRLSEQGAISHRSETLAQWRHHDSSTSIIYRGERMAQERIDVIRSFFANSSKIYSQGFQDKALANAYYMAARLSFFSKQVPGRKFCLIAFRLKRGKPERARFHEILFLLTTPVSFWIVELFRVLSKVIK